MLELITTIILIFPKINRILCFGAMFGFIQASSTFAQYDPINPFIMPNDTSLNWYGSGDINNDNNIDLADLVRLDSILAGLFYDPMDEKLSDRSDINGDQEISNSDVVLLKEFLDGSRDALPAHWNMIKTLEERISWLEKVILIDKTEEISYMPEYEGDMYCDQLLVNLNGYCDEVLDLFQPPIDHTLNGRFNLPASYGAVSLRRFNQELNRKVVAILIGNNAYKWNDWCFIDPRWDQMLFVEDSSEFVKQETIPPFNSWMDDIHNFTTRDTHFPDIGWDLIQDTMFLDRGYFDMNYFFSDAALKNAFYYLDHKAEKYVLYRDSLVMDDSTGRLVSTYDTTGSINLQLKNGAYNLTMEVVDHFYNISTKSVLLLVDDPDPIISVFSPVQDSVYSIEQPSLYYSIEELDFSLAWYSLDSGQTKYEIDIEGLYPLILSNGLHQLILYAEDIFGNCGSDTVNFTIEKSEPNFNRQEFMPHLHCYPNPSEGIIYISFAQRKEGPILISLYDMAGKCVENLRIPRTVEQSEIYSIDLSAYHAGAYYLKCTTFGDQPFFQKIILQ